MTDDDHHDLDHDLNPMPERSYTAMTRRCLKCEKPFESEWSRMQNGRRSERLFQYLKHLGPQYPT